MMNEFCVVVDLFLWFIVKNAVSFLKYCAYLHTHAFYIKKKAHTKNFVGSIIKKGEKKHTHTHI